MHDRTAPYSMMMFTALLVALLVGFILLVAGLVARLGRADAAAWGTDTVADADGLEGPYRSGKLSRDVARGAPGLVRAAGGAAIGWGLLSVFVLAPLIFLLLVTLFQHSGGQLPSGMALLGTLLACDTVFVGFALMATGADVLRSDEPTNGTVAVRWSFVHHGLLLLAILVSGTWPLCIAPVCGIAVTVLLNEAVERVDAHRYELAHDTR